MKRFLGFFLVLFACSIMSAFYGVDTLQENDTGEVSLIDSYFPAPDAVKVLEDQTFVHINLLGDDPISDAVLPPEEWTQLLSVNSGVEKMHHYYKRGQRHKFLFDKTISDYRLSYGLNRIRV